MDHYLEIAWSTWHDAIQHTSNFPLPSSFQSGLFMETEIMKRTCAKIRSTSHNIHRFTRYAFLQFSHILIQIVRAVIIVENVFNPQESHDTHFKSFVIESDVLPISMEFTWTHDAQTAGEQKSSSRLNYQLGFVVTSGL